MNFSYLRLNIRNKQFNERGMNKGTMLKTSKDHAVIKETVLKESLMAWRSAHDTTFSGQKEMQTKLIISIKIYMYRKKTKLSFLWQQDYG